MRGLEQAVNIKLWPGNGEPVKAWGKLKRDPELWDETGDTLIFFGHGYEEPSFRLSSLLLEEANSPTLIHMLDNGIIQAEGSKKNQTPGVQYRLYMDTRSRGSKIDVLRYHVTTRNFFAFLLRKPLVGFTFYQALVDLHERLEEYLSPDIDSAVALQSYLVLIGLVDVSNEPRAAAGLLAWSEDVSWNNGWHEAFVHSVGMYKDLSDLQESADISLATTAHLERAHLELQARIHEAEDRLTAFYYDDAHFAQEDMSPTVRAASVRFRKFLRQFYATQYHSWPIRRGQRDLWLDRKTVQQMQEDFNALYEYSIDRNLEWRDDEESEDRKNRNLLKSVSTVNFGLDGEDLRMLGVFRNLDCRLNASHIPHPYPLLPPSMPAPSQATKKPVFGNKKKDKARESRIAHAYTEASNASQLPREHAENDLLNSFIRFEKGDQPSEIDPREARRERWIIIYCVLQTLAGISVDVPHLSFGHDVTYFLNPRLQGLPPWSPTDMIFADATREQSHCWTTAAAAAAAGRAPSREPSIEHSAATTTTTQSGGSSDAEEKSSATSHRSCSCPPLSPPPPSASRQSDTYTFFDSSNRDTTTTTFSSELEDQDGGYRFSRVTNETSLNSDEETASRRLPSSEYDNHDTTVVPAKFAAVAGIVDPYATTTGGRTTELPLRRAANQGIKRAPEVRVPKGGGGR